MTRRASPARPSVLPILFVLLAALLPGAAAGQATADVPDLSHLAWRPVGPAVTGGRIVDFAVPAPGSDTIFAATAAGGVWRTEDRGVTWTPLFQDQDVIAAGGIAVSPANPARIWLGTGEPNARNMRSVSWGDGVYRSDDGGDTWEHVGLDDAFKTGRVVAHPEDADVAWVSVAGPMWKTDPDAEAAKGLWKTDDGGESWRKVLDPGHGAGVVELALDPRDPDLLYAGAWDRDRVEWRYLSTGPGSGIFRSTDGGESWRRLGNGLPSGDTGKPGLSVCRSDPDRVYAVLEGDGAGLYRSDDRGASWTRVSDEVTSSMYYGQVRCDPRDSDRVYHLATRLSVSTDGGRTFRHDVAGPSVHVDHHAMWIDPADPTRIVLGNDGGIYLSDDRGESWRFVSNLPVSQFYNIAADMREPFYHVYGGTQDNNSLGGPSATRHEAGIVNADWFVTVGGDGFWLAPDPVEPWVVYTESQYGNLVRFDTRTGERRYIQPQEPLEESSEVEPFRWNWSAPILISPHDHRTVYFGSQYLHRSRNRGDAWEIVSPDLTRDIEYEGPGLISPYGTIRIIAESPLREGLLAVGTEDGLIQISEDGGGSWREVSGFPAPGGGTVPELHQVVRLVLSAHDESTIYAALSGHEWGDMRPYLVKSTDLGRSWTPVVGDLPEDEPIRALAEDPRTPGLLYVGTEFGLYASFDDGVAWRSLRNNLPPGPFHDLIVHPREHDLIVGTHGRGIWILDQTDVLSELARQVQGRVTLDGSDGRVDVFSARPGLQLNRFDRGKDNQGDAFFRAPNPPVGVTLDLWISPELLAGDGAAGDARLEVRSPSGEPVRRLELPAGVDLAGLHRVVWDMRHAPTYVGPDGDDTVEGPWVMPGEYEVRLSVGGAVATERVRVEADPAYDLTAGERREWHDVQLEMAETLGAARSGRAAAEGLAEQLAGAAAAVERAPGPSDEVAGAVESVRERVDGLLGDLREVEGRVGRAYRVLQGSTGTPTADQARTAEWAGARVEALLPELREVAEEALPALQRELAEAGVPWSPGAAVAVPGSGAG